MNKPEVKDDAVAQSELNVGLADPLSHNPLHLAFQRVTYKIGAEEMMRFLAEIEGHIEHLKSPKSIKKRVSDLMVVPEDWLDGG